MLITLKLKTQYIDENIKRYTIYRIADFESPLYLVLTILLVSNMILAVALYLLEGKSMKIRVKKIVIQKKEADSVRINCQRMQCRTTHKRKDC